MFSEREEGRSRRRTDPKPIVDPEVHSGTVLAWDSGRGVGFIGYKGMVGFHYQDGPKTREPKVGEPVEFTLKPGTLSPRAYKWWFPGEESDETQSEPADSKKSGERFSGEKQRSDSDLERVLATKRRWGLL